MLSMTTSTPRPPVMRATPSARLSAERSMTSSKPRAPCLLGLGRVGRRGNRLPRALGSGQLGDRITDRATDRRCQNGLATLEARLSEGNLRRQIGNRNSSGGRIIDVVRDQAEIFAAHGDPLAVGSVFKDTVRTGEHDWDPSRKRPATKTHHNTSSLVPQYQRRRRSWVGARQYGVVQRGDACCCDPDKYPPIGPTRSWYLDELQASVPRERLGAHGSHHYFSVSGFRDRRGLIPASRKRSVNVRSLWISVGDTGTLSQAAAERNVLARGLVEHDQEIIWRNSGSRDHAVVQGLQESQSLLLGAAGDKRDLQQNQIIRIGESQERRRMKELAPRQNVNDLEEVFRRNTQCAYEPVLDRARHPAETSLVVLSVEDTDLGEGHVSSPLIVVT